MTIYKITQSLIFTLFLLFLLATSSLAAGATFSWAASDEPISGYRIYYGTSSRNYIFEIDIGLPDTIDGRSIASVDELVEGQTYYFAITAYSENEESDYSVEVVYTVPVAAESEPDATTPSVVDQNGATDQATIVITAQPNITPSVPPTAIVSSGTAAGNAPLSVTFNGTSSTTTDSSLVSYKWTFGDGSQATGETISHVFTTAGTYHTQLTVLDSNGLSDSASTPVIVIGTAQANETPNLSISNNQTQEDATLTVSSDDVYQLRDQPSLLSQTQVSQLYVSIFGRASEGEGNAYWQSEQSDMIIAANTMLNTEPAKVYFGDTLNDNQAFIEFIYENTLGKTYAEDPDGVNYWVNELANGKSKGEVVSTLINAAMDPTYAGMLAQDQFINKVTLCNYVANTVATCPNVNDLCAFVDFISNVTYDSTTVVTAQAAVDAF